MDKARIGVFGGTFDPVHIGHLLLAEAARAQAGLSQVLFMPAHIQPFKQDAETFPDEDRVRMLRLAIKDNPGFGVTTVETDKGGVSYTIDSLRTLKAELGGARLCFIVGTDMFLTIDQWKETDSLIREFDFAVGVRTGYLHEDAVRKADSLKELHGARIDLIDNAPIELSSTEIRDRVRKGSTIRYLVPESVRRYLLVMKKVGEKRFAHTKRVMDLAVDMAVRYRADEQSVELAALLHDYFKDSKGGVENDLNHGMMAAEFAKEEFGLTDEDVLNAIRWHTTGRACMSKLEKILFLADTLEPGRKYDSIASLRASCMEDLDKGTLRVLIELKKYLERKGIAVAADTDAAITELTDHTDNKDHLNHLV